MTGLGNDRRLGEPLARGIRAREALCGQPFKRLGDRGFHGGGQVTLGHQGLETFELLFEDRAGRELDLVPAGGEGG
jgi:hypothetical protein